MSGRQAVASQAVPEPTPPPHPDPARALSYGPAAAAYAEHRPGYPDEAVEWALAPVAGRRPLRVLDLAAGTGKLAEAAARQDVALIAVEPDLAMRGELLRWMPRVAVLPGTAEAIPLPDARVDAVLVGQAFHWFDPERALPEIARVLMPGGVLAALWNVEDESVDWVAAVARALRATRAAGTSQPAATAGRQCTPPEHPAFGPPERAEFRHTQRRTAESYLATLTTHSWALTSPPEELEQALQAVRKQLLTHPETASGEFDLPLLAVAARMRLRV